MVRSIHKINIILIITLLIGSIAAFQMDSPASADREDTENINFNVNVVEALTVSLSTPTSWASGDADNLLRNKITISALTNNDKGVTVSMYADNTDLRNTTSYAAGDATTYIPTLAADTTNGGFTVNSWGYSLTDTAAGDSNAVYKGMTTSTDPILVLNSNIGTEGTKDVFFGAKASTAKQAGTYAQTVNFVAVTGTIDTSTNPADPLTPSTPSNPSDTPVYDGTTTTTSTSNISTLGIALASAAGVAAASGIFFLVAAKRRKDDEDE